MREIMLSKMDLTPPPLISQAGGSQAIKYWGGGQISNKSLFSAVPPSNSLVSVSLERLFELTRRPSRALASPRALLPELQRYKDSVRCGELGAQVPGHL